MSKKKSVGAVVAARATEGTTHAGLAALAQVVGFAFPQYAVLANVLSGVFASIAVALPEVKKVVN